MLVGSKSRGDGVEFPRHPCVTKVSKRGLSRENGPAVLLLPASPAQAGGECAIRMPVASSGGPSPILAVKHLHTDGRFPPRPPHPPRQATKKRCGHKGGTTETETRNKSTRNQRKDMLHFSVCACHPCAGSMRIFSVSFAWWLLPQKGISVRRCQFSAIRQRWELDDSHGDLEDT